MSLKVESWSGRSGWHCPGCGGYHSPDVQTCPVSYPSVPYQPYIPAPAVPYPYVPNWPDPIPMYPNGDKEKRYCNKCGIELSDVMMYVCMNPGCPTGLGGPVMLNEVSTTNGKSDF